MKKKTFYAFFILILTINISGVYAQNHNQNNEHNNTITEHHEGATTDELSEHDDGEHDSHGGMEPLWFIIVSLLIGAATRNFLSKTPLPYTVLLLIFGLLMGVFNRLGWLDGIFSLDTAVTWAGHIDPHVILYVFLPTLVFEAAFAMDVHTFKKSVTNATLLAVPGIVIALLLTGALAMGLQKAGIGLFKWDWAVALMFGAVVSATDPVAVVSLLKELGASKKLGTLIEGESLLNDGTAIVIFMVFFLGITGAATGTHPVMEFVRVSFGGILLGVVIGAVTIAWVRRVFNDALVEISVIVAAAYLAFFIAEHFLHVSGVLGLVALGLAMASVGKTRISPEVQHFLHEFWELAAFIANTLIFIIVGVVIAQRTVFEPIDFVILFIIYIGIHIVRAIVIAIFFPAMKRIGYGLSKKDSYVLWWGALRGAIGLALALVIANVDDKYIAPEIKNQFLFLTAGIVTLTLLVNATTIKYLVDKLGLTKIAPAKALMIYNARKYLRTSTENSINRIKKDRFMNRANWNLVVDYLPEEPEEFEKNNLKIETIAETRRRILEKEKSSYWHQFKEGLIGANAVRSLSDTIDEILDEGGMVSLSARKDLEQLWKTSKFLNKLQNIPIIKIWAANVFFNKLAISYESAHGFLEAQEEALKMVESMYRSLDNNDKEGENSLATIEEEINENKIHALTYLRNLRKTYPEIYDTIATRQAIRTMLNYELHTIERLQKNGRINSSEAVKMTVQVEERMKKLMNRPPKAELPETIELLSEVSWIKALDKKHFEEIVDKFQTRLYAVGDDLIKAGTAADSIFVISRGTVKVTKDNEVIALLGPGNTVGEMTVLNEQNRTATVTAESPVTALRIKYLKIQRYLQESDDFRENLWNIAGYRFAENLFKSEEPFSKLPKKKFKQWLQKGKIIYAKNEMEVDLTNKIAIILSGKATSQNIKGVEMTPITIIKNEKITLQAAAHIFINQLNE